MDQRSLGDEDVTIGHHRRKLMIVDDLDDYLRSLQAALSREWNCVCAHSLVEARQRLADEECDVALVDVRLSEADSANRDGIELLEWIRERYPSTSVVMMSGYRDYDAAVEALNLGARQYLRKPIDLRELKNVLRSLAD
jgi:DNA-binding NtrC family response regulator